MRQERLTRILLGPHVSEKASRLADRNKQMTFKVVRDATKPEIKKAVEVLFKVKVADVQLTRVRGKVKRFGQKLGRRKDWKKAYVSLLPGYDIDFAVTEG